MALTDDVEFRTIDFAGLIVRITTVETSKLVILRENLNRQKRRKARNFEGNNDTSSEVYQRCDEYSC